MKSNSFLGNLLLMKHTKDYDFSVIGLGLMGMSFLKAIAYKNYKIWGLDTNEQASKYALESCYTQNDEYDIEAAIKSSKVVILAVIPSIAIDIIKKYKHAFDSETIVCDFCGIKNDVYEVCKDLNYIGVHTMAGREVGGYENALGDIFIKRNAIIVRGANAKQDDVEIIRQMLLDIGSSNIVESDSDTHDKHIAFTSQLMHVIACAIVSQDEFLPSVGFEGNSLRDHTRVGTIDAVMWSELFINNKEHLAESVKSCISVLEKYEAAIKSGNKDALKELLQFANENKKRWMNEKHYNEP